MGIQAARQVLGSGQNRVNAFPAGGDLVSYAPLQQIFPLLEGRILMFWHQHNLTLPALTRGFHPITGFITECLPELAQIEVGLLHVFIQHTSASLTINENADPDVLTDLESSFSAIAPENFPYIHTMEGPDDMPAHVKASLLGNSLTIPVERGQLALGTWQGIFLCEHRNRASRRHLVLTLSGQTQ